MYKTLKEIDQDLINSVLIFDCNSVVLNNLSLQNIEDYLSDNDIELDHENTLETNSHTDVWIGDTTNTYQISGDMWTGVYTFERLSELEK